METHAQSFEGLDQAVRQLAQDVAAPHAGAVDAQARFPAETVAALRRARVLSAAVPQALGGAGLTLRQLGQLCATLGRACGSSGMVLAMHTIQVACLARHAAGVPALQDMLHEVAREQVLLASITSEVGTWGDTRASAAAVDCLAGRFVLNKEATTGSYCAQADAILVTARRAADAPPGDQVLALVRRGQYTLTQTTSWDTLGMRGTCSPGFRLESSGPVAQILPVPYAEISAQTMVPYSHVLWSALWGGIAAEAYGKAAAHVRALARKAPGTVPPQAQALAVLAGQLQTLRLQWQALADEFDALDSPAALGRIGWALKLNQLKTAASALAPQIVHGALQVIGIQAYKNDSPLSLSRPYRDSLSAALMISNDRITARSAALLLVHKDD